MTRWPPPPRLDATFYKAHGLGNDYLVFEEGEAWTAAPAALHRICHRQRGVGSDGIVVLLGDRSDDVYRLRMFNPDGSEFERSGNGLRVLASYLARRGAPSPCTVSVGGSRVTMHLHGRLDGVHDVSVEMGRAATGPAAIGLDPASLDRGGRLSGPAGEPLDIVPVSMGNPHVVVLTDDLTEARLAEVGPWLAVHPALAAGTNVQLAGGVDERGCRALIWERGVGRTSASGTSACAVAVAMVSTGRLPAGDVVVDMSGGHLTIGVSPELDVLLRGPVQEICEGELTPSLLTELASYDSADS